MKYTSLHITTRNYAYLAFRAVTGGDADEKRMYGASEHPDVAKSLNNIATMYHQLHDYDKALSYNQEALQMRKRINGTSAHPDLAKSLTNIALLHRKLHDYDKALS